MPIAGVEPVMKMKTMKELNSELRKKLEALEQWFGQREGSIVAFSGGIDSTLVLYLARKFQGKEKVIGIISNSESLKTRDLDFARRFCEEFDIRLEIIKTEELADERYNTNPENRCYFCKEHLFRDLSKIKKKYPAFEVLSGTNRDDLGDYRPGLQAAANYKVQSPMLDCQVSKEQLREIARYFDIPNWNKPASPCLSSRIPYKHEITNEKLRQVEAAEEILNDFGFEDVRLRHYGSYGLIEVRKQDQEKLREVQDEVMEQISKVGFNELRIDQEGLVSGKLNRAINK